MLRPTGRTVKQARTGAGAVEHFPQCRSVLFAPGNRRNYLDRLFSSGADLVVADLEDGVPADSGAKGEARRVVGEWLTQREEAGASRTLLRVNPLDSPWLPADVELAFAEGIGGVVVPKAEDVEGLRKFRERLDTVKVSGRQRRHWIIGGIETAKGLFNVEAITLAGDVDAIYFGAEDYITDLGGRRTADSTEVLFARSRVALAARLGEVTCIDQVVVDLNDDAAFSADAALARDLGFLGKHCIHPRQVSLANQAFTPSSEERRNAREIVEAAETASQTGRGVVSLGGRMIDYPLIERARRLLVQAHMEDMGDA